MELYFDGASHSPSPKVKTYQMKDDGEHLTQFFRLLNNKVEQQQRCITDPHGSQGRVQGAKSEGIISGLES